MVLDDECKPNVAVQAATQMAAEKDIIAAATHYCSSTAIATVDVYHKFGLPVVVWGAVLPDITYRNKYPEVHRVNGTMINQNEANAELVTKLGYKTFAVIHDTTDYGKGHNEYFSAALAKLGGKIVGTFGVGADQQDFTAELTQIKALNPEVIYFGGLTPIGVRIRAQMDKLGIKALFDGTSGIVPGSPSADCQRISGPSRRRRSSFVHSGIVARLLAPRPTPPTWWASAGKGDVSAKTLCAKFHKPLPRKRALMHADERASEHARPGPDSGRRLVGVSRARSIMTHS